MQVLGNPLVHLRLLGRMGKTVGADLVRAFEDETIDSETWAKMITKCRGCDIPDQCHTWLETTERAEAPPPGCCNADMLLCLKDKLSQQEKG